MSAPVPRADNNTATDLGSVRKSGGGVFDLPNLLTYARIVAVPMVAACLFGVTIFEAGLWLRWVARTIFVLAALTEWLDGWAAR
jgi:cardiolipin synthase